MRIFLEWAKVLRDNERYDAAIEQYRKALKLDHGLPEACIGLGDVLEKLGRYREAIESYCRADEGELKSAFAYHSAGYLQWRQGNYGPAWKNWSRALVCYEAQRDSIRRTGDVDQLNFYAHLLHEVFQDLPGARAIYEEAVNLQKDHIGIATGIVRLYRDMYEASEEPPEGMPGAPKGNEPTDSWRAQDSYNTAREVLINRLEAESDPTMLVELGDLTLLMGRFGDTSSYFERALELGVSRIRALTGLGIMHMRKDEKDDRLRAIAYLSQASREDQDDLTVRCFLAQAYLRAELFAQAQAEYETVLERAPDNIDALIGLGGVRTALGEAGDREGYQDSIDRLSKAVDLAGAGMGSRLLTKRELSAAYYSRGYARIRLYQASVAPSRSLMVDARKDFKTAYEKDKKNRRAKRAAKIVADLFPASLSGRLGDAARKWLVVSCALTVFALAIGSVFFGWPVRAMRGDMNWSLVIFGALLFVIAGLYLPQLLKIRVAGVELEKSVPDVTSLVASLAVITREGRFFIGGLISRPSEPSKRRGGKEYFPKAPAQAVPEASIEAVQSGEETISRAAS